MAKKTALTSEEKSKLIMSALEDKKAVEPTVIDVRGRTLVADFFIIASGTSKIHIKALIDGIVEKFTENGIKGKRLEGLAEGVWVLLDYGDVVVHVLAPEQREFYRLETYWSGEEKGSPPPVPAEEE